VLWFLRRKRNGPVRRTTSVNVRIGKQSAAGAKVDLGRKVCYMTRGPGRIAQAPGKGMEKRRSLTVRAIGKWVGHVGRGHDVGFGLRSREEQGGVLCSETDRGGPLGI